MEEPAAPLIVVAPDSFKGSCDAALVASSIAEGLADVFGDTVRIRAIPLADGGEGTLDALIAAWGGRILTAPCSDALGRIRTGRIGLSADGRTAIVEAAEANGLPHVTDQPLRALDADTYGVGLLALAALYAGAEEILLCVGGSATNDGGAGMLRALGARLFDAKGEEVRPGVAGLESIVGIDTSGLDRRALAAKWRVAVDVDNPLTGPRGAAEVFAVQKGANAGEVRRIDSALALFARVLAREFGVPIERLTDSPGLGAAGGMPLMLTAVFDADLEPGSEIVARTVGLDEALSSAALVITGEGRLDSQSLEGKVVSRVLLGPAPTVVISGSVELTASQCREAGIAGAFSLARGAADLDALKAGAPKLLREVSAQIGALIRESGALNSLKNKRREHHG